MGFPNKSDTFTVTRLTDQGERGETVVDRAYLIQELDSISPSYYDEVADFIGYLKERKPGQPLSLEDAAQLAIEDYRTDSELTAFTALDGEDFYEAE